MSAYRFCRTDDMALLVDALNRCRPPAGRDAAAETLVSFKRAIRELQVWCSSCIVALSGSEPIGVLIGAKRTSSTLVHRVAVHVDHRRRGHARHLLDSLRAKLAILGPPRIVAEVPDDQEDACALFRAGGYTEEARLTDYAAVPGAQDTPNHRQPAVVPQTTTSGSGLIIPTTVDDLAANGLVDHAHGQTCWERSTEAITSMKETIRGLALASDDSICAYLLYRDDGRILSLRTYVDDEDVGLRALVGRVRASHPGIVVSVPKVHPDEFAPGQLERIGLLPAGRHRRFCTTAQP